MDRGLHLALIQREQIPATCKDISAPSCVVDEAHHRILKYISRYRDSDLYHLISGGRISGSSEHLQ
jgi:hypothetical protein